MRAVFASRAVFARSWNASLDEEHGRLPPTAHVPQAAKFGAGHGGGDGTSRDSALRRYGSEAERYKLLDEADLDFYARTADAQFLDVFHYGAAADRLRAAAPDGAAARRAGGCPG